MFLIETGTRPTLLERILLDVAPAILDRKAPPAFVTIDGARHDVEQALNAGKRPDAFPKAACAELVESVPIGLPAPTVGQIVEHLYLMNHRREQSGPLTRGPVTAVTPGGFCPIVEQRRTEPSRPQPEVSRELQDIRARVQIKRESQAPLVLRGTDTAVANRLAQLVAAEEPLPSQVTVDGRQLDTAAFLDGLKGDTRPCPFPTAGLNFTYSAPMGDPTPPLSIVAGAILDQARRIGAV